MTGCVKLNVRESMVAEKKSAIVMGHPVVTSQIKTGNSKNNNNNNNCGSTR